MTSDSTTGRMVPSFFTYARSRASWVSGSPGTWSRVQPSLTVEVILARSGALTVRPTFAAARSQPARGVRVALGTGPAPLTSEDETVAIVPSADTPTVTMPRVAGTRPPNVWR